jgi:hypothetical protein
MSGPLKIVNPNNVEFNLKNENIPNYLNGLNVIGVNNSNSGRTSPVSAASDPKSFSSTNNLLSQEKKPSRFHTFFKPIRRVASRAISRLHNNVLGVSPPPLSLNAIRNEPVYKKYLQYKTYQSPKTLQEFQSLVDDLGYNHKIIKTLKALTAEEYARNPYNQTNEKTLESLLNALATTRLTEGGKRKNKTHKRKTKKFTLPPAVGEEAIEILAEVAVGGKRRKTRRAK